MKNIYISFDSVTLVLEVYLGDKSLYTLIKICTRMSIVNKSNRKKRSGDSQGS